MANIPNLIIKEVDNFWIDIYPSKGLKKFFAKFNKRIKGIEIIENEFVNENEMFCEGRILNRWFYDAKGLREIDTEEILDNEEFATCCFANDPKKNLLLVNWINKYYSIYMPKGWVSFGSGCLYKVTNESGKNKYSCTGTWIE